jgi:hypothetical protein
VDIVNLLLDSGIDPKIALRMSIFHNRLKLIDSLLKVSFPDEMEQDELIKLASVGGNLRTVRFLLDKGMCLFGWKANPILI